MSRLLLGIALLAGCASPAPPLGPRESPDLVLVLAELADAPGPSVTWSHAWPPTDDVSAARAALLLGRWPDDASPRAAANGLGDVLGFYGYRSAAFVGGDHGIPEPARGGYSPWDQAPGCLDARLDAALRWGSSGAEPWFVLVIPDATCPAVAPEQVPGALAARRVAARVAWVAVDTVGSTTADHLGETPIWLGGPPERVAGTGAPDAADRLVSTFDVLPTLLALARATAPSDAQGRDLLDPSAAPRAGVVQELRGGDLRLHRRDARLRVPASRVAAWAAGTDGAEGDAPVLERGEAASIPELEGIVREWSRRRRATTATERMGAEAFEELQGSGGYWP